MSRHKFEVVDGDVEIFASCLRLVDGRYAGALKVVRKRDHKVLFPFEGAPLIGPHETPEDARRAALEYGRQIALADRKAPER